MVFEPGDADLGDAITLDDLRERGRARDAAEVEQRYGAVRPDDICLYIYTSGTTGPPKGCLLSHGNYSAITDASEQQGVLAEGDTVYLFLPLAHAFALLIQFVALDLGGTIAYWEKDPQKIIANLTEVNPTYFPSVPRMFEKIYTLATLERAGQGAARARRSSSGSRSGRCNSGARRSRRSCSRPSTAPRSSSTRTSAASSATGSASA